MLISRAALRRFSALSPCRRWDDPAVQADGRAGRIPSRIAPQNAWGAARRPVVADLVVLRLSSDPILDPLLAERLLLTLTALGVPADVLPKMFQRAMGVIFEMILTVSARSKAADQKMLSTQMHKAIAALPPTEFPNLTQLRKALVAETVEAGASKPNPEVAALYADRLIATLAPG
jgi:hypothetical protein